VALEVLGLCETTTTDRTLSQDHGAYVEAPVRDVGAALNWERNVGAVEEGEAMGRWSKMRSRCSASSMNSVRV
jgi:hypothetical protein